MNVLFTMDNIRTISMDYFIKILSISVCVISLAAGLSTYNLRNILGCDPTFSDLFRFMLSEQFCFFSMFLFHERIFLIFIRCSLLNKYIFYIGVSIYLFFIIFLPKLLNITFKFPIKFESHMLICFPNFISSCYRKCNKISEYQSYRQIQLIHSLIMSAFAICLNQRMTLLPKLMMICTEQKDLELMFQAKYIINAVLGFSSLLFIVEIICIEFGFSFLDFAFKKACEESSSSVLSEVNVASRKDAKHLCTLDIKTMKRSKIDKF